MIAEISDSIWMWIVGGTCGIVVLLTSVIGGFMLNSILDMKKEIKHFRLEFAAFKGEVMTLTKFKEEKKDIEKERDGDMESALSFHLREYKHEKGEKLCQ